MDTLEQVRKDYKLLSRVCLIFIGSVILLHVVKAWRSDGSGTNWWLLVVNAPILWYWVTAKRYARGNHRILSRYAESCYFMGYVATIGALLVVAIDIAKYPDPIKALPEILIKGASAVASTVFGLTGMFWLRVEVQTLEEAEDSGRATTIDTKLNEKSEEVLRLLTERSEKMAGALDRLLKQFDSNQTAARQSITKFVEELGTGARIAARNLGAFDVEVQQSREAFRKLQLAASDSERIAASWSKIESHVDAVDKLIRPMVAAAEPLSKLAEGLERCKTQAAGLGTAIETAHGKIDSHIAVMQEQTTQVGGMAKGVKDFTDAAIQISPTIDRINYSVRVINESLSEIIKVKEGVEKFIIILDKTSLQFNKFDERVLAVQNKSYDFSTTTEKLVEILANHVARLGRLTQPLQDLGQEMELLRPKLQPLAGDGHNLVQISGAVGKLNGEITSLNRNVDEAGKSVSQFAGVARDWVRYEAEQDELRRKSKRRP